MALSEGGVRNAQVLRAIGGTYALPPIARYDSRVLRSSAS
jgi:hypothetical protein